MFMANAKQRFKYGILIGGLFLAAQVFAQSGSAGGASSQGATPGLEYCDSTLGTVAVVEDTRERWWADYYRRYPRLGSTVPVLRMMLQQTNCFVVVERGRAMKNMMNERALEDSGEMRSDSGFGKGQIVAADYTINPSIQFAEETGGLGGALSGLLGSKNRTLGKIAGGLKKKEASTTLILIDNRSGVQLAAATGNAGKFDFKVFNGLLTSSASAAVGGYTKTPEGKVIAAAFADSLNHMIRSLRNYKAQNVDGGLGKGGKLRVGQ